MADAQPTDRKAERRGLVQSFGALRHANYRWYWISGFGMNAAQGMKELVIAWLVLDLTGSVAKLGIAIFMQGLPQVVVALWGGVLADQYDRRKLLISSQSLTVLNLLILACLTISNLIELWHVYVSSVVLGITQAFSQPARQAYMQSMVDRRDLPNAVALNALSMNFGQIVWPSVAGVLITLVGTGLSLVANSVVAAIGIAALFPIRGVRQAPAQRRAPPITQVADGLRYTWSNQRVAAVVGLGVVISILVQPFNRLAPAFARQALEMNAAQTGLFLMVGGIGSVAATAVCATFNFRHRNRVYVVSCLGLGIVIIALVLTTGYVGAFILMLCHGVVVAIYRFVNSTTFQLYVPSQFLGRVYSLWGITGGFISMSAMVIGIFGQAFGLRVALGGAASLMVLITLGLLFAWKPARNLLAAEREPALTPVPES